MFTQITHQDQVNRDEMTDQIKDYLSIKDKYPHSLLFYRAGDYYECFFEDASVVSDQLELVITYKRIPDGDRRIIETGIGYHALYKSIETLLHNGYSVIVADSSKPKKSIIELDARNKKSTLEKLLDLKLLTFMG